MAFRSVLFTLTILLAAACGERGADKSSKERATASIPSKYESFIAKFKPVSFDTLQVYSAYQINSDDNKFKGAKLDSSDFKLIPAVLKTESFDDFFACYQFPLDESRIALITRAPSYYDATSLKLLVYDKSRDTIDHIIELAENVGDGGEQVVKTSWLFKNGQQKYAALIFNEETLDRSMDDENPVAKIDTTHYYYLVDISGKDTLDKDFSKLESRFRSLLKTRESPGGK